MGPLCIWLTAGVRMVQITAFISEFIVMKYVVLFPFGFLAITKWPQARTVSLHFTTKPSIQIMHYHFYRDWTFLHLLHISCLHTAVLKPFILMPRWLTWFCLVVASWLSKMVKLFDLFGTSPSCEKRFEVFEGIAHFVKFSKKYENNKI